MSTVLAQQAELNSAGPIQPFNVTAPAGTPCASSTPGIIIHDDGQAENGYGWQPTVTDGRFVEKFTPTSYPATFSSVCFSLITNAGVTTMPFDIVVYAADGAGGSPGTVLGTKSVTGNVTAISGVPFTPTFQSFDISDLALNVTSGNIFIGLKWAPSSVGGVFISADQSSGTPIEGGYSWSNTGPWQTTQTGQANYRALMIRAVQGPAGTTPSVSKSFSPTTVVSPTPSTLTITLSNPVATAATLQSDLTDTFPTGLVVAATPNASTTCGGTVTAAAGSGSVSLSAAGSTIPASGSCVVKVDVTSSAGGSFTNTIPAGGLHTSQGDNATAATAAVTILPAGSGNGIINSGLLNHDIPATTAGTSLNIVSATFDDSGPISGNWDFNFWASGNPASLTVWKIGVPNEGQYAVGTDGKVALMHVGDVVGPSTTFSSGASGSVSVSSDLLAGVDGYIGVKFNCNGRLTFPVTGVCYGYLHVRTTGTTGFPATIVETSFDGDGNPITIVAGTPANPPAATVTPASLSFSVLANATQTQTLNIANAAGSDPLTYSIEGRGTSSHPLRSVLNSVVSKNGAISPNVEPKLAYLRNRPPFTLSSVKSSRGHGAAPWSPIGPAGDQTFVLDDGSYEAHIGLNDQTSESAAIWLNRFAVTGPLTIDSVSIMWPLNENGTVVGLQANIVAYYDADGDGNPANAVRLGTDNLVTIASIDAFENYTTNFSVPGAGDVYIGFVDQWAVGGFTPLLFPAAEDQGTDQGKSYVSANSQGDPDLANLANNDLTGVIGDLGPGLGGNWLIRATGTGGGTGAPCTGPVVSWLSATPSSGSVNGGANANVTIKADPAAGSLAPGSYTAELCVTTNDPAHELISVPVTLTVNAPPFVPCSGGSDEIFCDGFDGAGGPFTQPIQDPSFEATTEDGGANPNWTGTDSNSTSGGTPFWTEASAGAGHTHSGNFTVWGGGWRAAGTQTWSQSVTIASGGPRYLNYWRNVVLAPNGTGTLTISLDGSPVSTVDIVANGQDADWTNVTVDISTHADNAAHELKFDYTTTGTEDGNVFIDDVTIDDHAGSTKR